MNTLINKKREEVVLVSNTDKSFTEVLQMFLEHLKDNAERYPEKHLVWAGVSWNNKSNMLTNGIMSTDERATLNLEFKEYNSDITEGEVK